MSEWKTELPMRPELKEVCDRLSTLMEEAVHGTAEMQLGFYIVLRTVPCPHGNKARHICTEVASSISVKQANGNEPIDAEVVIQVAAERLLAHYVGMLEKAGRKTSESPAII